MIFTRVDRKGLMEKVTLEQRSARGWAASHPGREGILCGENLVPGGCWLVLESTKEQSDDQWM